MRKATGLLNGEKNLIVISKYAKHALPTLVHELLHLERNGECESEGKEWEICIGKCESMKNVICPECDRLLENILDKHFEKRG